MTVEELRTQLSNLDGTTQVAVFRENPQGKTLSFDIEDISMRRGTPKRDSENKPDFAFKNDGSANWLFIRISRD
jgi:hypothetical protein